MLIFPKNLVTLSLSLSLLDCFYRPYLKKCNLFCLFLLAPNLFVLYFILQKLFEPLGMIVDRKKKLLLLTWFLKNILLFVRCCLQYIYVNVFIIHAFYHLNFNIGCYVIVCQWLAAGQWFSLGNPVSSTNKTDLHDILEILLKVALNTLPLPPPSSRPLSISSVLIFL